MSESNQNKVAHDSGPQIRSGIANEPVGISDSKMPLSSGVVSKEVANGSPTTPDSNANNSRHDRITLWLTRADRALVAFLVVALLVLMTIHWIRLSRWGIEDIEISSREPAAMYYSLDINTASWVEWAQLEGIGAKLAKRIVSDREERGPFRHPEDVGRVPGITPRLLESMKPFLQGGTDIKRAEEESTTLIEAAR